MAMKIIMRDGSGQLDLAFLVEDMDRHGNVRVYFRRGGRKTRIREKPGTEEFIVSYRRLLNSGASAGDQARKAPAPAGSLRKLCEQYYQSAEFKRLVRRDVRRRLLDNVCEIHGTNPWALMEPRHVRHLRDEHAERPEAANARVKALRQVFAWAIEAIGAKSNPAREVPYIRSGSEGHHTWTIDEVRTFEDRHPVGTKARLAFDILLLTGVRRSDAVRLGRQMERDQGTALAFTEHKGRRQKPKTQEIPLLPSLRASIDATPSGHLTYIVTEFGKPFTANGFGNWFRRRCDEAGLPGCSAHGLRKAGATIAAERGASEHELMAIYGWESPKQAALYTRKANRKKLAKQAMHLIEPERKMDADVPLANGKVSHRDKGR
jgi:integrase